MTALLEAEGLVVRLGGRAVVDGVDLRVEAGEVVGLLGPNGAGKSTLMRGALGLVPAAAGRSSLLALAPRARARAAAWLPQAREIAWPLAVEALVALGRAPHGRGDGPEDRRAVDAAMAAADVTRFRDRPAQDLSGGEQARVLIARALAQGAPLLMADEPAAGLDPAHALDVMAVLRGRAAAGGAAVVSMHDLGLAARTCTRILLLDRGRAVADGPPREVLTPDRLAAVYGVQAHVTEVDGALVVQATGRTPGGQNASTAP